jgi:hypothetical protein
MIIGLAGFKGSGKDTVAAYLIKEHGFERKAFADPLKRSVAALFDIPFADVDKLKNDNDIRVAIGRYKGGGETDYPFNYGSQSFREVLQRYGTEAHRDVFGQDFWLDYTLPVQGFYPGRAIVVTDVRFKNEAERVRELGGFLWFIDRPLVFPDHDLHASELFPFEVDANISNMGTLEELYERVEQALSASVVTE